jgi:phosphohistidine phosphatase
MGSKSLLILRHAKSSWEDTELDDHDRPLAERGKRDAPLVGELIRERGLVPDLVLSSTAKRARKTAWKTAASCGYAGAIELDARLYHGDPETIMSVLRELPEECERALIVGHNPALEELLEALTGHFEPLTTAALARVDLAIGTWDELGPATGEIVGLWRPTEAA